MVERQKFADLTELQRRIGYEFRGTSLIQAALTHGSALPQGVVREAERLEFLGDAVLNLVIAELLLRAFPSCDEGQLSRLRALLVRNSTLAKKARELGLGQTLLLGRGEDRSGGRAKASILAATYEAVVGAVFLDGGFDNARAMVERHFGTELRDGNLLATQDWKTMLQERAQAALRARPEYRLVEEKGPAHARQFSVEVWVGDTFLARGDGPSKRAAAQNAARSALGRPLVRD